MNVRVLGLTLFLCAFGFYLHFAAPSVTPGDSGEFITAAATLSLPHAPSFPLYTLTGKAFTDVMPLGSVPYRCNIFSAFTSACTLLLMFALLLSLEADPLLAVLTVLVIGLSVSFWENSLVTEVFALNSLFSVALLYCLTRRSYALFCFVMGLGLGNHQILLFLFPAFAVALLLDRKRPYFSWAMFFLIGLSIYLVLPIRSMKQPPLNWGQPTTVERFVRTLTRKDYGSTKLTLGDAPERNGANTSRHLMNYGRRMVDEVPFPALLLALWAVVTGLLLRRRWTLLSLTAFVIAGPFFYLLGNLPFTAQSEGVIGRFMIMPLMALLLSLPFALERRRLMGAALLIVCAVLSFQKNGEAALMRRSSMMVLDYARAMMRTMPAHSTLFLDGGDDAFYSLAMLQNVMNVRPDVELHDRGGLIFRNPYGGDFRSLSKEEKQKRRWQIEPSYLLRGPVLYSTMDEQALPGFKLRQSGFLYAVDNNAPPPVSWAVLLLRSVYPLEPHDYRSRALGVFFPYMRGREALDAKQVDEALPYFHRAKAMGADVDWFQSNIETAYARNAYALLIGKEYAAAEKVYRDWIRFNPQSEQAQSNLGVVLERAGRLDEARAQYEATTLMFPKMVDAPFNLAVLAWKAGDWPRVVSNFEEVLRRKPDHLQAQGYLKAAREKMKR